MIRRNLPKTLSAIKTVESNETDDQWWNREVEEACAATEKTQTMNFWVGATTEVDVFNEKTVQSVIPSGIAAIQLNVAARKYLTK